MTIEEDDSNTKQQRSRTTVCIVGCNRAALTTACLVAEAGYRVFCVDSDQSIVNRVKKGQPPFAEPELEQLLEKNVRQGQISATTDIKESIPNSNIILIFVAARIDERKRSDYSSIEKACKDIGLNLHPGTLVILESDLAPGTTEALAKETLETGSGLKAGIDFGLAYCSTQALSGTDSISCPKVFAAIDKRSSDLTRVFLSTITKGEVIEMSTIKTAETVRLFENVYRDANIALANDLASFCERAGIDFTEARRAVNLGPGNHLFAPGIVGGGVSDGSYLLIEEAENLKARLPTVMIARKVNDGILNQVFYLVKDAMRSCGRTIRRAKILVLGVSSRPNAKEIRGSFTRELAALLLGKGMIVKVYDPFFSYKDLYDLGYPVERTFTKAVKGMDCVLITVGHDRFRRLNLRRMRLLMKKPSAIVDLGCVVNPSETEKEGFVYRGLGRGVWTR